MASLQIFEETQVSQERRAKSKFKRFQEIPSLKINLKGVAGSSEGKESACNAGHLGSTPRLGRSPGGEYSCLENSMDREAWQTTVHGITKARHD